MWNSIGVREEKEKGEEDRRPVTKAASGAMAGVGGAPLLLLTATQV